jgi:predicted dehydrogenase/inosine-uridine nucleoside N-ribohydrolase
VLSYLQVADKASRMQTVTKTIIGMSSIFIFLFFIPQFPAAQFKKPVPIIFDTDMGPDYDDVGALAMLHAMADKKECSILATMASNKHKHIAAVLSVLNTYFNRPGLPIGVVRGNAVDMGAPQKWDSLLVTRYPHAITSNENTPDALELYRKILAAQPDTSVTIVTVGFLTNLANLLESKPDKYSPLTGKALIQKKVKLLVSMAACFDKALGSFKEFNVVKDSAASGTVFTGWPTPVIFSGFEIGSKIFTGLPLVNSDLVRSPVKDVFSLSIPLAVSDKKGRMSWDETAVLVAVRGYQPYFNAVKGQIISYSNGSTGWDNRGERDHYLVQKMPIPETEELLNGLIMHQPVTAPVRIAIAGISHGHSAFILQRKPSDDITLVGVFEPNNELAQRYAGKYHFSSSIIYNDLDKMLDSLKPEAVLAFGSIYDHMKVVEKCAPRGIHVMVEKPLATSEAQANRMQELASKYHIQVLTDFETSWYPSTAKMFQLVQDSNFTGRIKKVVVHDGHQGPKEINVNPEFFEWLTDPVQNGGGALTDFGCYGANLVTLLMKDEEPISVTAVTAHYKPSIYPKVEDEATIIVTYPSAQCIIQASWNWPFGRKDLEVYGDSGYIITADNSSMRIRNRQTIKEKTILVTPNDIAVYTDPFSYFVDVIRGKIRVPEKGLYSLENNVRVVRILDAARKSAESGRTVALRKNN